jgi:hypothetical protein
MDVIARMLTGALLWIGALAIFGAISNVRQTPQPLPTVHMGHIR